MSEKSTTNKGTQQPAQAAPEAVTTAQVDPLVQPLTPAQVEALMYSLDGLRDGNVLTVASLTDLSAGLKSDPDFEGHAFTLSDFDTLVECGLLAKNGDVYTITGEGVAIADPESFKNLESPLLTDDEKKIIKAIRSNNKDQGYDATWKLMEIVGKMPAQLKQPEPPITETITPEEKELLTAYRTGKHLPMHQHMIKHRDNVEKAFWRERLADYQPLGVYDEDKAEHDDEPPTPLEYVAMHVAHELSSGGRWINRRQLWGMGSNYSDLIREIGQAMLSGLQDQYGDLRYLFEWLDMHGNPFDKPAQEADDSKGGDDE